MIANIFLIKYIVIDSVNMLFSTVKYIYIMITSDKDAKILIILLLPRLIATVAPCKVFRKASFSES